MRRTRVALVIGSVLAMLVVAAPGVIAADRTWPTEALTTDHITGLTANHELASDGSSLFLTYVHEPTPPGGDLLFRRSDDAGLTWTDPVTVFSTGSRFTELAGNLAIVGSGNLVVIAFRAHDATRALLFTIASHDGGRTWDKRVRVAGTQTDLRMGIPAMTMTSTRVVVAWTDRTTGRIYVRSSKDGAVTFGAPQLVARTQFSFICGNPNFTDGFVGLGADGSNAYLDWTADPTGGCAPATLRLRRSTDGGKTWLPRQLLPGTAGTLGWPEIAAQGSAVALFAPMTNGGNLLLRSTDSGASFSTRSFPSTSSAEQTTTGDVAFAADGSLRLTYGEFVQSSDGSSILSSDLIVRQSLDDGATWGPRSLAASAPADMIDASPNLAVVGDVPVVVFNTSTADESTVDIDLARLPTFRLP